jgi:hypothetical protein
MGVVFSGRHRTDRKAMVVVVCMGIYLAFVIGMVGCGGGSSSSVAGGTGGGSGGGGNTPPPSPVDTTTTLMTSAPKQAQGAPLTLTAQVSSSASAVTGTVAFFDGDQQLGNAVSVSNRQASLQTDTLGVGVHNFAA